MDKRIIGILIGLSATIIILLSPFVSPIIAGSAGILFAIILYFVAHIRYFSLGLAIISLLYAISFIPLFALDASVAMILAGEGVRVLFKNTKYNIIFFGLGSTLALVFVMIYTNTMQPLVGALAETALLMLRSILANRDDGSMISLIGVAMIISLFMDLTILVDLQLLAFSILFCAAFGFFAYRAKTIDASGLFSIILFGIILITCTRGFFWFFIVLAFFIIGSLFTKFKYAKKKEMGVAEKKSGRRGYKNAFANVGVAILSCIFFTLTNNPICAVIFTGSIATATADTLASEIGMVLGKNPRMITNLKPCPPGMNGGITAAGELACIGGSFIISLLAFLLGIITLEGSIAALIAGFIGTNIDSLIGSLVENKGYCKNEGTNLAATLLGGITAGGIFLLISLI